MNTILEEALKTPEFKCYGQYSYTCESGYQDLKPDEQYVCRQCFELAWKTQFPGLSK